MKTLFPLLAVLSLTSLSLQGGTITAAGIDTLTPPGTGASDLADLDANDSGQDGFVIFNSLPPGGNSNQVAWDTNLVSQLPAYIANLDGTGSTSSGGWSNYDQVLVDGTTYDTGGINLRTAGGVETPLFSFELSGVVPESLTIGLLTDNTDNVAWSSSMIRLGGPDAESVEQSPILDGASDLVKFTINGGADGETYTVFGTSAGNGSMIAMATFDLAVDLTDPTDTDGDGMGDNWEEVYFGDLTTSDGTGDADEDGATDLQEWEAVSNPTRSDSDGDGLSDGEEINTIGSNPNQRDSDEDGLPDFYEVENDLDPTSANGDDGGSGDPDGDTVDNLTEFDQGTDPREADTDGDGYDDGVEDNSGLWTSATAGTGTDPLNPDSDNDGIQDGTENPDLPYQAGNPGNQPGTDPNLFDSDGDGASDGYEVANGTDPTSAASTPLPSASLWSVDIQGVPGVFPSNPVLMTGSEPNSGIYSGVWNAFDITGHSGTDLDPTITLVNARGEATPVTLSINGLVSSWSNPAGPNPITNDYLFVNAGNAATSATWEISGLSPATEFIFYPYGGIGRDVLMTVDTNGNGLLDDETPASVPGAGLEFLVTSDSEGTIIGAIDPGNSGEANWGGFQLASTSEVAIVDTDGDGLSDNAESAAGTDRFNPDTDGDGQSDGAELRTAGTDPLDPQSYLRITQIDPLGEEVALTWTSVEGKRYDIETSPDLEEWTVAVPGISASGAPAATTTTTVSGPTEAVPKLAYRVRVAAP